MFARLLLPETVARQDGSGAEIALDNSTKLLLLTLGVTNIVEQASLEVSIWGSADGNEWREIAVFPRKSYCGVYVLKLDLGQYPEIRRIRPQWKMGCWGKQEASPMFGFYLLGEEARTLHAGAA